MSEDERSSDAAICSTPMPSATPKRRSIYDTIKNSNVRVHQIDKEYIEKCKLEMETHDSILNSTKEMLKKLKESELKKTIPADVSKLEQRQKDFLKKSPNYKHYLELVEDIHTHLAIEGIIQQKLVSTTKAQMKLYNILEVTNF